MNICVYGAVNDNIDISYKKQGELLGNKIAERNHGLIFGGMKGGMLGAVARGVSLNKNVPIIAVMPEFFKETKQNDIFEKCTEKVFTKDVSERKKQFNEKADAIIITPGGVGTLDEFFDAVCSKRWGYFDKPIVIYNIDNYYKHLIAMLEYSIEKKFGKENYRETYKIFDKVDDIFEYIENYKK